MSYEKIRESTVICRKRHRCVWCGERIEINDPAVYRVYRFDGDFNADYLHPECNDAMLNSYDDLYDGFDACSFKRGMTVKESEV